MHFDLGLLFYHMHDYNNSIREYKRAIALNPTDPDTHRNLAVAYQDSGDIDSAVRTGREAKKLSPNDPHIRQNLASALMLRDEPAAVLELRELETMFPNFETAHEMLGRCLVGQGEMGAGKSSQKRSSSSIPLMLNLLLRM